MEDNKFVYSRGVCAVVDGQPIIERDRIMVVIQNIKTQLFLVVEYKSNNEICFVTGGVDEGHTLEQTAFKEIEEETGITSLLSLTLVPEMYYEVTLHSPVRHKNYLNKTHGFFATTEQEDLEISEEEQSIQQPHWRTLDQIKAKIVEGRDNTNYESMQYIVRLLEKHLEQK